MKTTDHVGQSMAAWFMPYGAMRTDAYVLLGALLTNVPTDGVISMVRNLGWEEDLPFAIQSALAALRQAGELHSTETIALEYQRIFVGLGSGELVPYASWYLEKMIQSTPLVRIRQDLQRLGIARQAESGESEDHAGGLCEIMALLSRPGDGVPEQEQATFFFTHIGSWMERFFMDLQNVKNASFYPMVGGLGRCFLAAENEYLGSVAGH